MLEFDFAHHIPSILVGVVVGILAFAPLLVALVPVLRRKREANMTVGFMGVFTSFLVLFLGVIVTYLWHVRCSSGSQPARLSGSSCAGSRWPSR